MMYFYSSHFRKIYNAHQTRGVMSIETVVCTISDEGTPRKKELVSETMENLHRLAESKKGRLKVVGVHLGGEGEIAKMM